MNPKTESLVEAFNVPANGVVELKSLTSANIIGVLSSLPSDISILDPATVCDYLSDYPDMIDLLPFVCKAAMERVGSGMQLSLEVYRDPEIDDEHLSLYIRSEDYDEQVLNAIRDIEVAYADKLVGKSGWIIITTDFGNPR